MECGEEVEILVEIPMSPHRLQSLKLTLSAIGLFYPIYPSHAGPSPFAGCRFDQKSSIQEHKNDKIQKKKPIYHTRREPVVQCRAMSRSPSALRYPRPDSTAYQSQFFLPNPHRAGYRAHIRSIIHGNQTSISKYRHA